MSRANAFPFACALKFRARTVAGITLRDFEFAPCYTDATLTTPVSRWTNDCYANNSLGRTSP